MIYTILSISAAEGLMLGSVCVYFQADAVLIAVGICAAVTLALTLFAFQVGFIGCICIGNKKCMMVLAYIQTKPWH